jgi:DNA-directed RNA polymerase sigma subunit (sigma70/sigma32)
MMSHEERYIKCTRCGQPLNIEHEDDETELCETCQAELDAEISIEAAEVQSMLKRVSEDSSLDFTDGTDELPLLNGGIVLNRQQAYTKEDHDWMMQHDYWGKIPETGIPSCTGKLHNRLPVLCP